MANCSFRDKLLWYVEFIEEYVGKAGLRAVITTVLTGEHWGFRGELLRVLLDVEVLLTSDSTSVMGLLGNYDFSDQEIFDLQKEGEKFIMGYIASVSCIGRDDDERYMCFFEDIVNNK